MNEILKAQQYQAMDVDHLESSHIPGWEKKIVQLLLKNKRLAYESEILLLSM